MTTSTGHQDPLGRGGEGVNSFDLHTAPAAESLVTMGNVVLPGDSRGDWTSTTLGHVDELVDHHGGADGVEDGRLCVREVDSMDVCYLTRDTIGEPLLGGPLPLFATDWDFIHYVFAPTSDSIRVVPCERCLEPSTTYINGQFLCADDTTTATP